MNNFQIYKQFQTLHELTKTDQKEFFEEFKGKTGINMIHIPQTCWDLFVLHNNYRRMLPINNISFSKSNDFVDLSNDFVNHIINNNTLFDHYKNGQYSNISGIFISEIRSHINKYNTNVKKIFLMEGETGVDCRTCLKIFGHTDTLFPEVEKLLVMATGIEQECYDADEFPLWRHSRTSLMAPLEENLDQLNHIIIDLPLYQLLNNGHTTDKTPKKLAIGTLCYGFSLLADFIGDGAIAGLGDFRTTSACTLSYFITELLSRKYASGTKFPFYLSTWGVTLHELKEKMKNETFTVSVTRLPKILNSPKSMGDVLVKTWFIPEMISANNWITSRGEESHPRHKGSHLQHDENKNIFEIKQIWNDNMLIQVLKDFLAETKNMKILILNGQVCETPELQESCTQLLLDRQRFSEIILNRDNAATILKQFVLETYDGIKFFKQSGKK